MSDGRRDFEGRGKDWTAPLVSDRGRIVGGPVDCSHPRPDDAESIHRGDFDELARDRSLWSDGPWLSSFGDGPYDPYCPPRRRPVWGRLKDGRAVWAEGED